MGEALPKQTPGSVPNGSGPFCFLGPMDIRLARITYSKQKARAKNRGVAWELSFPDWCNWWGEDIDRRGRGKGKLCMCRFKDSGPYALWNIYKGTFEQNNADRRLTLAEKSARRKLRHEQALNAMQPSASEEEDSDSRTENEIELDKMFRVKTAHAIY